MSAVTTLKGDIYEIAEKMECSLTIVFGHLGYNLMRECWVAFSRKHSTLSAIPDPFTLLNGTHIQFRPGQWISFHFCDNWYGVSDAQLIELLNAEAQWASEQKINQLITNGARNVGAMTDSSFNRQLDDIRTSFLIDCCHRIQLEYELTVTLISLNDVFVRAKT